MKFLTPIPLDTTSEQYLCLRELRAVFAQAKPQEIALKERTDQRFELSFYLESDDALVTNLRLFPSPVKALSLTELVSGYVFVEVAP